VKNLAETIAKVVRGSDGNKGVRSSDGATYIILAVISIFHRRVEIR